MENSETSKRRIKIIIGYIVLLGIIALVSYLIFSPSATCTDKIQNQKENGVDCGGPCAPCKNIGQTKDLIIQEVAFAPGGKDTFDVVAKIFNPNDFAGAESFNYIFTLKDESETVIATREGKTFILPSDTRYVAQLELATNKNAIPKKAEITISDIQCGKLSGIGKPQIGVYSKKISVNSIENSLDAEGIIRNESGYDFKKIDAVIIIRDENNNVLGINTTQRDSIRAKEEQKFNVTWPYLIEGNAQKIEVDPQTNIFDSQNFSVGE